MRAPSGNARVPSMSDTVSKDDPRGVARKGTESASRDDRPPRKIGVIILAAGASSRMGRPKPLLPIDGAPLVVRAARAALDANVGPVVCVLGNAAGPIEAALGSLPLFLTTNPRWAEGIGTSIQAGIRAVEQAGPAPDGALIALCDQPGLTTGVITRLQRAFRGADHLVAAAYGGTVGAPAVFGRAYFQELLVLPPDAGAQRVLRAHAQELTTVELPELAVDLDTPEEYERYLGRSSPMT